MVHVQQRDLLHLALQQHDDLRGTWYEQVSRATSSLKVACSVPTRRSTRMNVFTVSTNS